MSSKPPDPLEAARTDSDAEAAAPSRDYALSEPDFQRARRLLQQHTGICLAETKRGLVGGRLSGRLRALGLPAFGPYLDRLEAGNLPELQQFCTAITTNLTSFFREPHHFQFLAEELLPALQRSNADTRRIRIWSAGCASGEEAYSIAMVALETLRNQRSWDLRILATEVDTDALREAQRGIYEGERLEKVDAARLLRWFERVGSSSHYRLTAAVRELISFQPLNLAVRWPMHGPFDAIFCRNVLGCFDPAAQRDIVQRMAQLQRPGDHLILGHSEASLEIGARYRPVAQTIYWRRPEAPVR